MNNNFYIESSVDDEFDYSKTRVELVAKNDENEQIGYLSFLAQDKKIWLLYLKTEEQFQHRGVATALVQQMEEYAKNNHVKEIEGRYMPSNKFAKPFYNKMGYIIYQDGYEWFLSKTIDYCKSNEQQIEVHQDCVREKDEL